jgi:hypothetical protein
MQKRYRARDGHICHVTPYKVTDDPEGVPLPNTAAVREHVALGRLLEVPAKRAEKRAKED